MGENYALLHVLATHACTIILCPVVYLQQGLIGHRPYHSINCHGKGQLKVVKELIGLFRVVQLF